MKHKRKDVPKTLKWIGFFAILLQACFDPEDYNMKKLSDKITWTPDVVIPISYGSYSMWYLLNEHKPNLDEQNLFLENNELIVRHRENHVFSFQVADVLNFPVQGNHDFGLYLGNFPNLPFSAIPTNPIQKSVAFPIEIQEANVVLSELQLDANIQLLLSNPLNTSMELTAVFRGITEGEQVLKRSFLIPKNTTNQIENIELQNATAHFQGNENELGIDFSVQILNNASENIYGSGNLEIDFRILNFEFEYAKGDFGQQSIEIKPGSFHVNLPLWDKVNGTFVFENPKIHLYLRNSFGIPFAIDADLKGYNSRGDSQNLYPEIVQPENIPQILSDLQNPPMEECITLDKTNSNIVSLMALPPNKQFDYFGQINLNPQTVDLANAPNLIGKNSKIEADLEIEIPLHFSANNLIFKDTIHDIEIDNTDKITQATIVLNAKNAYPLALKIESILLTNSQYEFVDEIEVNKLIDAADVYASGFQMGEIDPESVKETSHEIPLSSTQMDNLSQAKKAILKIVLNTNGKAKSVKLNADSEFEFGISLHAKLDLSN